MNYKINRAVHGKLIKSGLLPDKLENLTDQQKEVYMYCVSKKTRTFLIIKEFLHLCNDWGLQFYFYHKIKTSKREKNLKIEDVQINRSCPFFKNELDFTRTCPKKSKYYPSIDRIDSTKGYVTGNVWIISDLANTIKNAATKDELKTFATTVLKRTISR
jgi:hypothetical protein